MDNETPTGRPSGRPFTSLTTEQRCPFCKKFSWAHDREGVCDICKGVPSPAQKERKVTQSTGIERMIKK